MSPEDMKRSRSAGHVAFIAALIVGAITAAIFWGAYMQSKNQLDRMVQVDCNLVRVDCVANTDWCCNPQINKFDCRCGGESACSWTPGHLYPVYGFHYLNEYYEMRVHLVGRVCPGNIPFDCSKQQESANQTWSGYNNHVCYVDPDNLDEVVYLDLVEMKDDAAKTGPRFVFSCIFLAIFCMLVLSASACCCESIDWSKCRKRHSNYTVEITQV